MVESMALEVPKVAERDENVTGDADVVAGAILSVERDAPDHGDQVRARDELDERRFFLRRVSHEREAERQDAVRRNRTSRCAIERVRPVGATPPPRFFSGARSETVPESLKMVGHGVAGVHGGGDVTFVITSDASDAEGVPGVTAPRMPNIVSITR